MKNITLENFFNEHFQLYIGLLGLFLASLFWNNLESQSFFVKIIYIIIILSIFMITIGCLIMKRGLSKEFEKVFHILTVRNIIVYRKEIEINKYSSLEIKKLNKAENYLLLKFSIINLFANHYEFSIYLVDIKKQKKDLLVSLMNTKNTIRALEFLQINSHLKFEQENYTLKSMNNQ